MAIKEVLADNRSQTFPFPTSLAVAVGDLLFWDPALVAKPANARTDKGSKPLNQADFRSLFLGVSAEQRLSTETSTGNDSRRLVIVDGIFDCDCTSGTFEVGDLVGIDRDATPLNMNQQVIKVSTPNLAIGKVVKREPSAVTKVRCRLTSSLMWSHLYDANRGIGGFQGQSTTAMADADTVLTVASNPIQTMTPTATRNVTLPAVAQSAGLMFYVVNSSTGFLVNVKNAGGTVIGAVLPRESGIFWCDGTTWFGVVGTTDGTGALGYPTGAGGAVTQITTSATAVTLNKPTGQITTVALTTAAAAEERFTVNNTFVAATDVIALSTTYNGAGTPMLGVCNVTANAFDIVITNLHAANAFNAAMVINFAVIKGAAS